MLIFLYVQDELSFDQFHAKKDSIYRMIRIVKMADGSADKSASNSPLLGGEMAANFSEVVNYSRWMDQTFTVQLGDENFLERIAFVDPGFIEMFSFPLLEGNRRTVMDKPNNLVLTETAANKYFGDSPALGKTLTLNMNDQPVDFIVSGVIEDPPSNSSMQFDLIVHSDAMKYAVPPNYLTTWNLVFLQTFIELAENTDIKAFETKVSDTATRLFREDDTEEPETYELQSLTSMHLNPDLDGVTVPAGNPIYSFILSGIALAVLIIACINFISLAVGRASSRIKEVGLRKVLGAQRIQLMKQYWGEALLLCVIAATLSVVLAELFLPTFNQLAQKELEIQLLSNHGSLLIALIIVTLLTAFLAGLYPALLLSKLKPVTAFSGSVKIGGKNRLIHGMVVIQFALSVFLLLTTFIIASQLNFVNTSDLGFNKDLVVTFPTNTIGPEAADMLARLKHETEALPDVLDVTGYSYNMGSSWLYLNYGGEGFKVLIGEDPTGPGYAEDPEVADKYFYLNWVDESYIPTMGIEMASGRNFSEEHPSDQNNAIILNEAAVKSFGFEDPIGKQLPKGFKDAVIVGVVEDFHFYPMHRKIQPVVLHIRRDNFNSSANNIAVRISGHDIPTTLGTLERIWRKISGGGEFEYQFLDDQVAQQYSAEIRWKNIVLYSSIFAFVIASIGLFGLTSLAVSKRTKEVGVRKVLGASVSGIAVKLALDFVRLVILANLIAWPVAYFVMHRWLEDFAYRMTLNPLIFLFAGILTLILAVGTVSYQSIKAAIANPVESLRYE